MTMIDAHQHLWRYKPPEFAWIAPGSSIARDFLATDLAVELRRSHVSGSVAIQARQSEAETTWLLDVAASAPMILGVVGWIDLRAPDIAARLAALAGAPGLVGFRHVVQDEADNFFLLRHDFINGVRAVFAAGLSYDLLINHAQMPSAPAFLDAVGTGRVILDHAAKPAVAHGGWQPWADNLRDIAAFPHVDCKISGLITEANHEHWTADDFDRYLDHVLDCFGPDRLIWGSDWPVCRLAGSYQDTIDLVARYVDRHCPEAHSAIFAGSARRAYRLDGESGATDPHPAG